MAAQCAEEIRQATLAIAQASAKAKLDAERAQAAKTAKAQADATRAAELQLQASQARAALLERERTAALEAERAAVAKAQAQQIELAELARTKAQTQRLSAAQLEAAQIAKTQAAALARAQADEREAQTKAVAQAQQAEQRAQALVALDAQNQRNAQTELARLALEKQKSDAALAAQKVLLAQAEQTAQVAKATPAPVAQVLVQTSYFKGFKEYARSFQKGDFFNYQVIDGFTKTAKPLNLEVTSVNVDTDRVEYNGGDYVSDTMGNTLTNPRGGFNTPRQFSTDKLFVGKKWISIFRQSRSRGITHTFSYELKVVARERITVTAGTFNTFRIEAGGFRVQPGVHLKRNIWVVPRVGGDIAHETVLRLRSGAIKQNDCRGLLACR